MSKESQDVRCKELRRMSKQLDTVKKHGKQHILTRTQTDSGYKALAYSRIFEDAEIRAQHGPVRVLIKDGKPSTTEEETK